MSVSNATTSPASEPRLHAGKQMLIDIDDLTVQLGGENVVEDVSVCIHAGEFIGLIGPNAAGKTTLLRAMLGLIAPSKGRVVRGAGAIGYVPQRGSMVSSQVPISVAEVVGLGAGGNAEAVRSALAEVKLEQVADKRFSELSGGQQQRVLIAKALATGPALLILDEPTTGIDGPSQRGFFRILARLAERGIAVVMVSHDIDVVVKQVNRVIGLNQTVVYDGPAEQFVLGQHFPDLYGQQHRELHHKHGDGGHHA